MEKDKIFFSQDNQGLTSTSANHVANLAKEYIQEHQTFLEDIKFYTTEISLLGQDKKDKLTSGYSVEDLQKIPGILKEISEATSLIAWLREAIKARENLVDEVSRLSIEEYAKANSLEIPEKPQQEKSLTESDYMGTLSIKDRNRYYALQTEASVIGQYIHQGGDFSVARKEAQKKLQEPHRASGSGRDTVIYHYTPTVQSEDIENMFFNLQKKYRSIQAEFNSMKYECEKAIKESEISTQSEYMTKLEEYNEKFWSLTAELDKHKKARIREIGKMKILIPNSLKGIYEKINNLDKK